MESVCPICLNEMNKEQECMTPCEHNFCYNCLNKWLRINLNCPICRKDIETFKYNNEINRLFVVNHIEEIDNLSINIEEVRSMIVNVDNYNIKIKKLIKYNKILSGSLLLSLLISIYTGIHCEEFRF
tara:strand:- start:2429 stop:2809 length:381 start_codon:yes stop_codon:yes gene_type:complete